MLSPIYIISLHLDARCGLRVALYSIVVLYFQCVGGYKKFWWDMYSTVNFSRCFSVQIITKMLFCTWAGAETENSPTIFSSVVYCHPSIVQKLQGLKVKAVK